MISKAVPSGAAFSIKNEECIMKNDGCLLCCWGCLELYERWTMGLFVIVRTLDDGAFGIERTLDDGALMFVRTLPVEPS